MTLSGFARQADLATVPRSALVAAGAAGLSGLAGLAAGLGHPTWLIGLVLLSGALVMGILNWRWSVYGLLLYLPFSGILIMVLYPSTAMPGGLFGISVPAALVKDLLFVIPAYVGFAVYCVTRRVPLSFERAPVGLFTLLALLVLVQAFNPALPNRLVAAIGVKVWLSYVPLYFLGYHLVRDRQDLFWLFGLMSAIAVVPATIGIIEALLIYGGQADRVYAYYGEAAAPATQNFAQFTFQSGGLLRRVPSTFSFVAQYYIFLTSMVAVTYAWWRGALAGTRFSFLGCLVWLLMLAAAFLSGARGAFLLIPTLVALTLLLERRSVGISAGRALVPVAAFAAAVAVLGVSGTEVIGHAVETARLEFMDTFVNGIRQAFAVTLGGLGVGVDTAASRYAFGDQRLFEGVGGTWYESWYVKIVLELGIVGLVLVGALLGAIVIPALRAHVRLRDPRLRVASAVILAFLAWNLIYGLKAQYIDLDPVNVYFWLLAGVLVKVAALDHAGERRSDEAAEGGPSAS